MLDFFIRTLFFFVTVARAMFKFNFAAPEGTAAPPAVPATSAPGGGFKFNFGGAPSAAPAAANASTVSAASASTSASASSTAATVEPAAATAAAAAAPTAPPRIRAAEFSPLSSALYRTSDALAQLTATTDVVKGVYEGGLKQWECSSDLLKLLKDIVTGEDSAPDATAAADAYEAAVTAALRNGNNAGANESASESVSAGDPKSAAAVVRGLSLHGARVVELGCGHGIPGIFALHANNTSIEASTHATGTNAVSHAAAAQAAGAADEGHCGASIVVFQDLNADVFSAETVPKALRLAGAPALVPWELNINGDADSSSDKNNAAAARSAETAGAAGGAALVDAATAAAVAAGSAEAASVAALAVLRAATTAGDRQRALKALSAANQLKTDTSAYTAKDPSSISSGGASAKAAARARTSASSVNSTKGRDMSRYELLKAMALDGDADDDIVGFVAQIEAETAAETAAAAAAATKKEGGADTEAGSDEVEFDLEDDDGVIDHGDGEGDSDDEGNEGEAKPKQDTNAEKEEEEEEVGTIDNNDAQNEDDDADVEAAAAAAAAAAEAAEAATAATAAAAAAVAAAVEAAVATVASQRRARARFISGAWGDAALTELLLRASPGPRLVAVAGGDEVRLPLTVAHSHSGSDCYSHGEDKSTCKSDVSVTVWEVAVNASASANCKSSASGDVSATMTETEAAAAVAMLAVTARTLTVPAAALEPLVPVASTVAADSDKDKSAPKTESVGASAGEAVPTVTAILSSLAATASQPQLQSPSAWYESPALVRAVRRLTDSSADSTAAHSAHSKRALLCLPLKGGDSNSSVIVASAVLLSLPTAAKSSANTIAPVHCAVEWTSTHVSTDAASVSTSQKQQPKPQVPLITLLCAAETWASSALTVAAETSAADSAVGVKPPAVAVMGMTASVGPASFPSFCVAGYTECAHFTPAPGAPAVARMVKPLPFAAATAADATAAIEAAPGAGSEPLDSHRRFDLILAAETIYRYDIRPNTIYSPIRLYF